MLIVVRESFLRQRLFIRILRLPQRREPQIWPGWRICLARLGILHERNRDQPIGNVTVHIKINQGRETSDILRAGGLMMIAEVTSLYASRMLIWTSYLAGA